MTKVEFSDFYKFIASLGVVLLSFSLLLPWLFLRESFDTLISVEDISHLTPAAQELVTIRQTTALWFIQNIVAISISIAVVGFILLVLGIFLWVKKQKSLDEKEILEKKKLELEIEAMTPSEIANRAIEEIQESIDSKDIQPLQPSMISQYFRIESLILKKLTACFGETALVLTNQRLKNYEYDIIVRTNDVTSYDVIIEIKFSNRPLTRQWLIRVIERLSSSVQLYKNETNRKAIGIILVVSSGEQLSGANLDELKEFVVSEAKLRKVRATLSFIPEEEIEHLECDDIDYILFPGKAIPK